jgi:hypothetical protein
VIRVTQGTAGAVRLTQTGQLTWNMAGIMVGLIAVLAILALGS